MKKNKASIVFAILSVFLFLGCVKELPSPVDGMIFRQYSATISGGTKTEDKGSGKVDWTKGDIIQYWSSDNGRIGTHTVAASGHTEKIKAEVGIDDEYLVAVYGGGTASDNSASGFILSDAICAEQTGAFEDAHISVAKTEKITSGTLQFRNVTSLIKFSINKTNVRKVVISANNGEKIHGGGRISVSTKNSSPIASFVDGGGSEISVSVSGPGTFYISTLPVTLSKGFAVSLYGTSNQLIGVISRSVSLTIKANTILDLGTLVPITGLSIDKTSLILGKGETESLTAIFYPDDATSKKITWSSDNESIATIDQEGKVTAVKEGSATITVTTMDGGYKATCSVTVKSAGPVVPEAVDLGLSVKWASFNIGASKPEEYGGYYQWAGLEDVTSTSINLNWNNCPYHTGSNEDTGWTKYIPSNKSSYWSGSGNPDNKTVLDPSDDVAHVKLGGKWRMPTEAEWTELRENCTWTWTTQNGVNGYKVTSKKSGYTSKSIFLPAAGYRGSDFLNSVGSSGIYWSSSLNTVTPNYAFDAGFSSGNVYWGYSCRDSGRSARPVYGDRVSVAGVSLSKTSLSLEVDAISTLNATVTPSNAPDKSVSWSSSNTGVATVDQSGKVTAVKAGSATITVTTTDGGYTATCSVTVKENEPYFVIDGQSNYSVDAGGGEFQFIVKSNVEWTIKDYSDGPYPYQHVTLASDGKIVKVVIDANEGYDARTSYIKFTVPAIQDEVLNDAGEPTGEYMDHVERVYFHQEGLTSISWETTLPEQFKSGTQLSIAKGAGQYVLYDGANLAMFDPESGAVQFVGPVLGDGTITYSEVLNDDAGNFIMVTPTAYEQAFDVYVIPGDTPVDQEVEPATLIHAYFDYSGYGLGHFSARGNVLKDGIVTAFFTGQVDGRIPANGAYWEIKDGQASETKYVEIPTDGVIWAPNNVAFVPLGTSAADGFLYDGYDGTYTLRHIVGGTSTTLATIGDWANGVTCIKPGLLGSKPIVAINNMAFFPERAMPSVLTIFDATSMAPITSVNILGEGLEGLYMTKPSTCILLEQEGDALVIYSADGAQGLIQKIVVPAK
ncbi:MAG: Ig-like domain-containing protein [Bacteroidales bacterium]|nr:Ig-like domain-containing protein [Candidatus Cryptobacteroides fimicaballi]